MREFQSREKAQAVAEKLKTYAQAQRLMILSSLLEGEKTVSEIDETTGIGQPALSQQLAELRHAELITNRREAKKVYYTLANENTRLCISSIESLFSPAGNKPKLINHPKKTRKSFTKTNSGSNDGAASFAKILS
jgi:DNA-binding transcriptional ArsR family regulator